MFVEGSVELSTTLDVSLMKIHTFLYRLSMMLILSTGICGVAIAMSLKLPSPAELSGTWRLFTSDQRQVACELSLNADEPASVGNPDCATRWLKETPTGWVPTPDGLALIGKDGTGLIHFNRLSEQLYQARLPGGEQLNLERVAD